MSFDRANLHDLPTKTLLKFCNALDISDPQYDDKRKMCRQIHRRAEALVGAAATEARSGQKKIVIGKRRSPIVSSVGKKTATKTVVKTSKTVAKTSKAVTTTGKTVAKKGFSKSAYRKFLKWAFTGFKVAAGSAATIVSFGGGADTITDLIFTVADTALFVKSIADVFLSAGAAKEWVKRIYDIPWGNDPANVKVKMDAILTEIEADKNAVAIKENLCRVFSNIIDKVAALFGSLISLAIPDDGGITRLLIESIISQGKSYAGRGPFEALAWIYNKLPQTVRDVFKNKESIESLLMAMVAHLKDLLPNKNDSVFRRAVKHLKRSGLQALILPIIPGGILLMPIASTANVVIEFGGLANSVGVWVDQRISPNMKPFALLMSHVLPLSFAATVVFTRC